MANINNRFEYINDLAAREPEQLVADAEKRYVNIVDMAADRILEKAGGGEIVMLAGPSSAGKTTTAKRLKLNFESRGFGVDTISLDDFYLDKGKGPRREDGTFDFETVHALDLPLIHDCLLELMEHGQAEFPQFDFTTGKRMEQTKHVNLGSSDVIVIEGLHALNPIITDTLPHDRLVRLYISLSSRIYNEDMGIILNKRNMRFVRRMVRDYKFRNSSTENTYCMWDGVLEGEEKYLMPYRDCADIRINSVHIYEPCVFRDEAIELLEQVEKGSAYFSAAERLIKALRRFCPLPAELVPESSLLREFLGYEKK